MRKIISFMHISLDGFVAGPKGEMDWITINDEIFDHVEKRVLRSNIALYGRITYSMMESYWPTAADKPNASRHDINHSKWYRDAHKIVLSKTLSNDGLETKTTIISDNVAQNIAKLKEQPGDEILIFGSPTATHALMEQDLVDGYWLFVNPVILGQGIPLFENTRNKVKLNLVNTQVFGSGVTELDYVVAR